MINTRNIFQQSFIRITAIFDSEGLLLVFRRKGRAYHRQNERALCWWLDDSVLKTEEKLKSHRIPGSAWRFWCASAALEK